MTSTGYTALETESFTYGRGFPWVECGRFCKRKWFKKLVMAYGLFTANNPSQEGEMP